MYLSAIPDVRPPNTTCGIPNDNAMHVFRDPIDSDLPWPAMIFGITINAVWYWCTDQVKTHLCIFSALRDNFLLLCLHTKVKLKFVCNNLLV